MSGKCKSMQGTRFRFKLSQGSGNDIPFNMMLGIVHKIIALFKIYCSGARICSKPIPSPRAKLQDASGSNIRSPLMKIRLHAIPMNTIPCGGRPPSEVASLSLFQMASSYSPNPTLSLSPSVRPSVCSLQFDHLY